MQKSISILLLSVFLMMFCFTAFASATDSYSTGSGKTSTNTELKTVQDLASSQVETVTIGEAEKWAERKGFELVHFLQKVVQPFSIIMFILSAMISLFGSFGNSQLVGRGIWGMLIAVIMYAVVLYAPEIMDSVLGWLAT